MPTHYQGTPEEEQALNVWIKLTRATKTLEDRLEDSGAYGELTPTQFGVLEVLYHLGSLCQGVIGDKLLKSSSNMTLVIDNLEKQGLVQRERGVEDRRQIFVHLTEAGRERIANLFPMHVEEIVELFSVLSGDEQRNLEVLLRKLGREA